MGDSQRGDFLRGIGEPLYLWMAAWLGQDDLNVRHRTLRTLESSFRVPHLRDHDGPAHSLVESVVDGPDGRRRRIIWLATDGWWADEVVAPSFSQVASWGLGLAPWMIVRYFRRQRGGWLVVPSLVLVVLFQLVILGLSIFGAVPKLRDYVAGIQLSITGSIGDVMAMIASPLQFSAMTTRLVDDLEWLHERVRHGRIAVVAYSQGTGVAHAALQASDVPVDLLVTFASALEKLHIAREVQQNPRRLALGSTLTIAGGIFLALAAATAFRMNYQQLVASAAVVGRWVLGVGAVLLMARMGLWFHLRRRGGALLTASGVVIMLVGLVLTAAALLPHALIPPGSNVTHNQWRVSLSALTPTRFRHAWSDNGWRSFALGFLVLGLLMVLAREVAAFRMPQRYGAGGPHPHPTVRPLARLGKPGLIFDPSSAVGNVVGAAALIVGLFCLAMAPPPDQPTQGTAILFLVVAGLAFCFAAVPIPIAKVTEPTASDFRLPHREGRLHWHNYWASADPVPDGNLPVGKKLYVINHEVHNRDSILADHLCYPENREDFLADVARHLTALAGWTAIGPEDASAIACAQRRRQWRVGFLTVARWVSAVGMVATWWVLGSVGLAALGHPLSVGIGYILSLFGKTVETWLSDPLLGLIVVAGITYFWYRCVLSPAWSYWDSVEGSILARHHRPDSGLNRERTGAVVLFALASAIGICAAVWSPNLLRLVADHLKVLSPPAQKGSDRWSSLLLRWPWQREALVHSGLWGVSWLYIGVVTLVVVTSLYALLILSSIRSNST